MHAKSVYLGGNKGLRIVISSDAYEFKNRESRAHGHWSIPPRICRVLIEQHLFAEGASKRIIFVDINIYKCLQNIARSRDTKINDVVQDIDVTILTVA